LRAVGKKRRGEEREQQVVIFADLKIIDDE
jgi:hypothetical protein